MNSINSNNSMQEVDLSLATRQIWNAGDTRAVRDEVTSFSRPTLQVLPVLYRTVYHPNDAKVDIKYQPAAWCIVYTHTSLWLCGCFPASNHRLHVNQPGTCALFGHVYEPQISVGKSLAGDAASDSAI